VTVEIEMLETQIRARLENIKAAIIRACQASRRLPDEVQILAISKRQPIEVIQAAYNVGINTFGESYVQEALEKKHVFADIPNLHWEMVGHIQSRKARQVAENFDRIHSLDSLKLAERLSRLRPAQFKPLEAYLEVNLAEEESKGGFRAKSQQDWQNLLPVVETISQLPGIKLIGLMAMPPLFDDPQKSRPFFLSLRLLKNYLNEQAPTLNLTGISAGTSGDFEIAIEEGATVIRIGEAILGARDYSK
jgi:pyridoxal phosphate enzyme (YggS family)